MTPAEKYAREHGVSTRTALRHGVERAGGRPVPEETVAFILEQADFGEPIPIIATETGINIETIRDMLKRHGRKPESEWRRVRAAITNSPALQAMHEEIMKVSTA